MENINETLKNTNIDMGPNHNSQDLNNSPVKQNTTIDYIYYVEWRQFTVEQNNKPSTTETIEKNKNVENKTPTPITSMQMTHSRALVGEFHQVLDELKSYHDKMAARHHDKQKKRVRFQVDEKLITSIPNVLQVCDIHKIDKPITKCAEKSPIKQFGKNKGGVNNDINLIKNSLDDADEVLPTKKHSKLFALIKKYVIKPKLHKVFARKSRRVSCSSEEMLIDCTENTKALKVKKMERSNSYCRHDDADNVILIDGLEIEEIDDGIDYCEAEQNPLQNCT